MYLLDKRNKLQQENQISDYEFNVIKCANYESAVISNIFVTIIILSLATENKSKSIKI